MAVTGPEADANVLVAKLAPQFGQLVAWYAREYAGSNEDPRKMAEDMETWQRDKIAETPLKEVAWRHVSAVARGDLGGRSNCGKGSSRRRARSWRQAGG